MAAEVYKSVYLLGIGGIGMSALARYFTRRGASVSGYDKTPTQLTAQLEKEGIEIHYEEDPGRIPEKADLVIWTPAVPKDNAEYQHLVQKGFPVRKRAEVLGEIVTPYPTIAVGGTHGKTTTATLIAHLFQSAGKDFMAFLGGISKNYATNFVTSAGDPWQFTGPPTCIVEADEYDRSFLHLSPDIAVITSMDPDHLDIYIHPGQLKHSFEEFTGKIRPNGSLILKVGVPLDPPVYHRFNTFSYALNKEANFFAKNIFLKEDRLHFDLVTPAETIPGFNLEVPGMFNLENTVAALAVGYIAGIGREELQQAIGEFRGVYRRFDVQVKRENFIYVDDYAHHPEELRACFQTVRELYPGKKITAVFQPHLYTRTRDLAEGFAAVLGMVDSLILLDIYPARESPIPGVSSEILLQRIHLEAKRVCRKEELVQWLKEHPPEVLLTLGAGDIDQLVDPICKAFT